LIQQRFDVGTLRAESLRRSAMTAIPGLVAIFVVITRRHRLRSDCD